MSVRRVRVHARPCRDADGEFLLVLTARPARLRAIVAAYGEGEPHAASGWVLRVADGEALVARDDVRACAVCARGGFCAFVLAREDELDALPLRVAFRAAGRRAVVLGNGGVAFAKGPDLVDRLFTAAVLLPAAAPLLAGLWDAMGALFARAPAPLPVFVPPPPPAEVARAAGALGVSLPTTAGEVRARHKALLLRAHADAPGEGTEYTARATPLNLARDRLLTYVDTGL